MLAELLGWGAIETHHHVVLINILAVLVTEHNAAASDDRTPVVYSHVERVILLWQELDELLEGSASRDVAVPVSRLVLLVRKVERQFVARCHLAFVQNKLAAKGKALVLDVTRLGRLVKHLGTIAPRTLI